MTDDNPGRKLRVGIIGAGRIAQRAIAPAIRKARNAELVAAASRDLARATSLKPLRSYDSYAALLDDSDVDVVFITTHNGLHEELTIDALREGKHVICEKPLGRNAAECERMLAESRRSGRRLMEAFMYRFHPQIAALQQVVRAGRLGELNHLAASFHFDLTRADDVRLVPEWGGGALLDVGCYCVNASRLFLGDNVSTVAASAELSDKGVDVEGNATLRFAGGATAELTFGFRGPLRQRLVLTGSEGVASLNWPFAYRGEREVLEINAGGATERVEFDTVDTYQLEIEDFCDALLSRREPMLAAEEGLLNARVLERIRAAISAARVPQPPPPHTRRGTTT